MFEKEKNSYGKEGRQRGEREVVLNEVMGGALCTE